MDYDQEQQQNVQMVPCFYCGNKFKGKRGLQIHEKKCDEK